GNTRHRHCGPAGQTRGDQGSPYCDGRAWTRAADLVFLSGHGSPSPDCPVGVSSLHLFPVLTRSCPFRSSPSTNPETVPPVARRLSSAQSLSCRSSLFRPA